LQQEFVSITQFLIACFGNGVGDDFLPLQMRAFLVNAVTPLVVLFEAAAAEALAAAGIRNYRPMWRPAALTRVLLFCLALWILRRLL
jgi:hypothetical protein